MVSFQQFNLGLRYGSITDTELQSVQFQLIGTQTVVSTHSVGSIVMTIHDTEVPPKSTSDEEQYRGTQYTLL